MSEDLSRLNPVKPDPGKYQWVKGKVTGIDDKQAERTHTVGVPYLMPGVIIFVHGVNSDGEWYYDASQQFAEGLNERLGRNDLDELHRDTANPKAHRYLKSEEGKRIQSPVIPFWWGYKVQDSGRKMVKGTSQIGSTPAWTDDWGASSTSTPSTPSWAASCATARRACTTRMPRGDWRTWSRTFARTCPTSPSTSCRTARAPTGDATKPAEANPFDAA